MRLSWGKGLLIASASLFLFADGIASAQYEVGISVPNWTVPVYRASSASGGLSTMADISPGVAFVAMSPCRVFDTRNANGPYGGPRLLANTTRNFDIDNGPCTGIPAGVEAYSMNFGAILPDGANSFVTIWPTGSAQPLVSSINPIQGGVVANAAIVPAGTNGAISVFPNTGLHLYGDINGYFTDELNPGVSFQVIGSTPRAIYGETTSSDFLSVGVLGHASSTTGNVVGVWGSSASSTDYSTGTVGWALSATGRVYGVQGLTNSTSNGSAGVYGVRGLTPASGLYFPAGVRGESQAAVGVLGFTQSGLAAVGGGRVVDAFGNLGEQGFLGHSSHYGVYSSGNAYVDGNLTVTGLINGAMKPFIQPHPYDASKEIRYVSLEGPHSEVYFRGNAQIAQGITRISIPEDFRLIADPQTYSTLVTPVGGMATVAVLSEGRDGIVVAASRDVRIHYVVYAERETMRNPEPIMENVDFRPKPGDDLLKHLPEPYRRLMIQNGTLNPDGTVNMETARRLGWDKEWEKRERLAPQPSPE
jgi:hypothetical protein